MFRNKTSILDGGLASTLQDRGHSVESDPLWSARLLYTNQEAIFEVHLEFLKAGAKILTTASYQASVEGFEKHLLIGKKETLNLIKQSVYIARKASESYKDSSIIVAGSVGPYGACQADGSEYHGLYIDSMTECDVMKWHQPRIEALIDAGVDMLALETIPSLKEALALIRLLKQYPIRYWLSFSCKDEDHTNYGDDFGCSFKTVFDDGGNQLVAIGINCTHPKFITSLLTSASKQLPASQIPRIVYPNLGETWVSGVGWKKNTSVAQFNKNLLGEWTKQGAKIIGGCCRVSPEIIKAISDTIAQTA